MKILLINNIFYLKGGSETVYFNTAELLYRAGHDVRLFSISNRLNIKYQYSDFFARNPSGICKLTSYFYNRNAAKSLDQLLQIWHPDIAHVHLIWGGLSPSIIDVLHKHNIPVVHTAHDYRLVCPAYTFRNYKGEICEKCSKSYIFCAFNRCSKGSVAQSLIMALEMWYRNLFHNPIQNIDGFIFVSDFSRQKHIEHNLSFNNIPSIVLHNFSNLIPSRNPAGYFLYSGRLSKEKGCETLVKAFLEIPNARLVIAGSGTEEEGLKKLANSAKSIQFKGHLDKTRLFDLLVHCAYVIVPSECYENNPLSIIEAYSASKPVIAARIGGIPEIIEEGYTGYMFNPKDVSQLRRIISEHLEIDNDYFKMCQNVAEYYKRKFSKESYLNTLLNFYNFIVKQFQ